MNAIFFLSVILKGIGAVLEVLLQVLMTRNLGVDGYGTFSTWINTADLLFWIFFSALTKCNTYYLSVNKVSISNFKRKYYIRYVIPALVVVTIITTLIGKSGYCIIFLITGLELFTLDQSSTLLTQRHQVISLVGEYVLGRLILVLGLIGLQGIGKLSLRGLMLLYVFQYLVIIVLFLVFRKIKMEKGQDISESVSLKKWGSYQRADIIQSMIAQMPVLVQYVFSGAFEAGVVSVVLTVKKMINFISGPSAKVFLPEFSRLYRNGEKEKIRGCYASIMRIQMLFAGPLSVVLIGYPEVVLRILADKLVEYRFIFVMCSVVFILTATLGPCSGLLQMTGNENKDNLFREIALVMMFVVMWLFRKDSLFVLYGLCAQALLESMGKYYYVCKWMQRGPVKLSTYLSWWLWPGIAIALTYLMHWEKSLLYMILCAGVVFCVGAVSELKKEGGIGEILRKKK